MTPGDIIALARRIAEEEIGGPPPRCTGHKADRYNAAYNAVVKAAGSIAVSRMTGLDLQGSTARARATAERLKALGRRRDG